MSVRIQLRQPVKFGRDAEPVTELVLQPNGRALRDLTLTIAPGDVESKIDFRPYDLTLVGLRMAGIAGDKAFADLMCPQDIWEVGQAVLGFIVPPPEKVSQTTGSQPSES